MAAADGLSTDHRYRAPAATGERDPVCGMAIEPASAKHCSARTGKIYYFCSRRCLESSRSNPSAICRGTARLPRAGCGPARCIRRS
ncbi:MAG: YHS domain-containing protein [Alphaproteobacteria bacterium]|nr:YHS domain-containing protein [Alphaproteobacteria bacterium]